MAIGARIRLERQALGLTQEQLARRIGVTREAISQWETGAEWLRPEHLLRAAKHLNVTVDWLVFGTQPKHPSRHCNPVGDPLEMTPDLSELITLLKGIPDELMPCVHLFFRFLARS
jgi:transcriptional regulator with XRE-family HTH domain